MSELFRKYDVPAPRYTSYPTVPYWTGAPGEEQWLEHLRSTLRGPGASWALYLHIPFCESLCTFCGCNNIITRDHRREDPYVDLLLKEWTLYRERVPALGERPLQQLHLGGGTPTFLGAANLERLLAPLLAAVKKGPGFEASIEVDPRRTNAEQLRTLRRLGFNRLSLGVQDFNPEVQRLVNRTQGIEITRGLMEEARALGYGSVNFDLIYGLAKQTPELMARTADLTLELSPDRIALYSFALVPWIKPAHRLFKDEDLPTGQEKRALYEIARKKFLDAGYVEIGMDHFAKPGDSLAQSMASGKLHRNFMGYADLRTDLLLGLGVSSISETPLSFHQNEKLIPQYEALLGAGRIPTTRGHLLDDEDQRRREQILTLMTKYEVELESEAQAGFAREFLGEMLADGLVRLEGRHLRVTEAGKPFLRNACVVFDERLHRKQPGTRIFSSSL